MQSRASTTAGVIHPVAELRRGRSLYQGSLLHTWEVHNVARQNHIGGKVALIRGVWMYDG